MQKMWQTGVTKSERSKYQYFVQFYIINTQMCMRIYHLIIIMNIHHMATCMYTLTVVKEAIQRVTLDS